MELKPITERFVLHWGEMGSRWGVNRTVAQIHALLYITGQPLPADEITDTLGIARSNVSTSLRELQNWKLVSVVHLMGDRRDHFTTSTDIWELFRVIVTERKRREFDPTIGELHHMLENPELRHEDAAVQQRLRETLQFMETVGGWGDEMMRLPPPTLIKIMKLGAKIQQFLRGGASKK